MAAPTEKTKDRPPYDVYATLLILSFLALVGATLLLNKELDTHWKFWADKNDPASLLQAEHLTYVNPLNDEWEKVPYAQVREVDLKEWGIIHPKETFPEDKFQWPAGYDLLKYPVRPDVDNLKEIPEDQILKLISTAKEPATATGATTTVPATPPVAPAPAPAPEAAPAAPAAPVAPAAPAAPVAPAQ